MKFINWQRKGNFNQLYVPLCIKILRSYICLTKQTNLYKTTLFDSQEAVLLLILSILIINPTCLQCHVYYQLVHFHLI